MYGAIEEGGHPAEIGFVELMNSQPGRYATMSKDNVVAFPSPEGIEDPLTELLRAAVTTDGKSPQNTGLRCPPDQAGASLCCVKMQGGSHARPRGLAHVQADSRIRRWARIEKAGGKYLRVILFSDKETIYNSFFNRGIRNGSKLFL